MTSRETILQRLRERQHAAPDVPPWARRRTFADLPATFIAALAKVKGEVIRCASWEGAVAELAALLAGLNAQTVVANDDLPEAVLRVARAPGARRWHLAGGQRAEALRTICAQADVGVSGADAALAETGTVVLTTGPRRSRLATLLPPVHIVLLPESKLFPDLIGWMAKRPDPLPANLVWVSGPSKTADIEQTMSIGVHGPKRFIVLLVS